MCPWVIIREKKMHKNSNGHFKDGLTCEHKTSILHQGNVIFGRDETCIVLVYQTRTQVSMYLSWCENSALEDKRASLGEYNRQ